MDAKRVKLIADDVNRTKKVSTPMTLVLYDILNKILYESGKGSYSIVLDLKGMSEFNVSIIISELKKLDYIVSYHEKYHGGSSDYLIVSWDMEKYVKRI